MSEDERKPIELPKKTPSRKMARDVTEALAGEIPIAGPLVTAVLRNTHPPSEEKERDRWEGEMTTETNRLSGAVEEHARILRPSSIVLSSGAAALAEFLLRIPHDGLPRSYMLAEMAPEMPGAPAVADVVEAADELALEGLVKVERYMNGGESVRPTAAIFEQLDPQVMGWDPIDDARHLAALLLASEKLCWTAHLHEASGWEKRRFNPAMRYLLQFFEPGQISHEIQPDYPTNQVMLFGTSKVRLKRFAASTGEVT